MASPPGISVYLFCKKMHPGGGAKTEKFYGVLFLLLIRIHPLKLAAARKSKKKRGKESLVTGGTRGSCIHTVMMGLSVSPLELERRQK